ncbi:hypothetical protein ABZ848_45890 [Streptomyces sp. NPDC047081]|uniref:hypothetical protein n=1 Tax=Streptomyces sp. NPDC047081 TaxID=3154706 RepID=UPI0033C0F86B
MDAVREVPVRDPAAVWVWRVVREPFTVGTWRRFAYALIAFPVGVVCVPLALVGAPAGRWQRGVIRRWLGAGAREPRVSAAGAGVPAEGPRAGLLHALVSLPLNLLTLAITLYGWAIVPMNLGWPLRAGSDHSHAWGGPTFAGAWAFHAVLGGFGFLLLMPWVGRGLAAVQLRVARRFLGRGVRGRQSAGRAEGRGVHVQGSGGRAQG